MPVLDSGELHQLRTAADTAAKTRRKNAYRALVGKVGVARPRALGSLDQLAQSDLDGRPFCLSRKWTLAASSAYKTFTTDANKLRLLSDMTTSSQPTQQPAGEVFVIDTIKVFVPSDIKVDAVHELLNKLGVRFHYGDGRKPFEVPFRLLAKSDLRNPNAGNNTTTVIEGTRTELIELGNTLVLEPEDNIVVMPGDTTFHVEAFWLTDYAASPPAGPAGSEDAIDVHLVASGERFAAIARE